MDSYYSQVYLRLSHRFLIPSHFSLEHLKMEIRKGRTQKYLNYFIDSRICRRMHICNALFVCFVLIKFLLYICAGKNQSKIYLRVYIC